MTYVNVSIWVSKEASGSQKFTLEVLYLLFKGQKLKIEKNCNFLCIFLKILCIFDLDCAKILLAKSSKQAGAELCQAQAQLC